jgi:serine/threonine protein kinase
LRGRPLAHFELLEPIGVGGMAAVIRARDTQLDRTVALKILPPDMASDSEIVRRFQQEARAAAKLDHENIARVFFCGEDQGLHFIAFEFVEGDNLRTLLERRGPIPVPEALSYMLQIATGLAHASARGVVHRDIKPSNIIISSNGRAKLVDMGLARSLEPQSDGGLTQSGVTLGTFDYISPEQALEPRDADVRSDIYSLGCTFYHMLTGQPPVPEGTAAKKLHHHQHVDPVDPRQLNPAIPDDVAVLLSRMMAKEPKDRYQRPEDLVQHLFVLAQKLGAVSEVPEGVMFLDAPLPGPPRARPVLLGVCAVLGLVALIAVLGPPSGTPTTVTSDPSTNSVGKLADGGATTGVPVKTEEASGGDKSANTSPPPARDAAARTLTAYDAKELAGFLSSSSKAGRIQIHLANDIVLTREQQLLIRGGDWSIEPAIGMRQRTIRLTYDGRPGEGAWAALRVQGGTVAVRGIRFELDAREADVTMTAVDRQGGEVNLVDCEFVQLKPPSTDRGRVSSVSASGSANDFLPGQVKPAVSLNECYFASGQHALTLDGMAMVQVAQCAFGPHIGVLFDLRGDRDREADLETSLRLRNCSVMLAERPVFGLDEGASCQLDVQYCLFSRPFSSSSNEGLAVLIEQSGLAPKTCHYQGVGNCYHNLDAYWVRAQGQDASDTIRQLRVFQVRKVRPGLSDDKSEELTIFPWHEPDPMKWLQAGAPRRAFQLKVDSPQLREARDPTHLVGVEQCFGGKLYDKVMPLLDRRPAEVVFRPQDRIVDPNLTAPKENTFKTLRLALDDVQPGAVVYIKLNGLLKVDPVQLEKAGTDVTIRPYPDSHPVLTLGLTTEPDAALFRVHDGKLSLEHLEFRLQPDRAGFRAQTVVAIMGDGQCTFKDCVATLEEGREVALSLVTLADPSSVMKMGPPSAGQHDPRVSLETCFVRGTGSLVVVRASRAFELRAEDCLMVLAGSVLVVDGNPKEPTRSVHIDVALKQVTTYLTEHLVLLRALKDQANNVRGLGLTQVKAADCLFAAATSKSLVHLDGLDGVDTEEQMKRFCFSWSESRHNAYSNFSAFLDQENVPNGMMPPTPYREREWKDFTGDDRGRFGKVQFTALPPPDVSLARVSATDFQVKPEANLLGYGVIPDHLPKPAENPDDLSSRPSDD